MGLIILLPNNFSMTTCLLSSETKDPSSKFMKVSIHRPGVFSSSVMTLQDDAKSIAALAKSFFQLASLSFFSSIFSSSLQSDFI